MEFRILGPLDVVEEGRSLPLGGVRQRALLAALILRMNEVVPSDRLLDEVWGDDPPASGVRVVQVYVSELRKVLGADAIRTRAPGYVLVADPDTLDLRRFERLVAEARTADPAGAAAALREALALWRGPPLADFEYDSFVQREIRRLEELRLAVLEARIEADLQLGRHAELVGELGALVGEHPLRERLRGQLMLALYRSGRQAEALEAYQQARTTLVEELGIEPGRELRELEKAILRQAPALDLVPGDEAEEAARGAFVGREAEFEELLGGLEDVLAGRGRLFLLGGEPGIGKSRLAEEVSRRAQAHGARVLVGRCWEAGGAPAYWPWVQSLRSYARSVDPDDLRAQLGSGAADVAQIVPELRELLPDVPEPAPADPEVARFRLFDAITGLLRNASARRPLVLLLDDLHAADTPSLLLLQFLARELALTRVLVLGAYRDVDPVPGRHLTALLAEVAREPVTRRILLAGLSEEAVARYLQLTGAAFASPDLVTALQEQTEGNPLFVGETVRLLALERGGTRLAIPESVRDVIIRRLGHLSGPCAENLALASVLGREFAADALARVAGVAVDEVLDSLDEAMRARVISDVPGVPGRLRFAHVLIRDCLYDGLTAARRVRLHRAAVAALEAHYGDETGPHIAELAHHCIAGSDFDAGLSYAERAGDHALDLLAYEEATRLYEVALSALDLARPADGATRCRLLLSLGEAQTRAGNTPRAKEIFVEAAAIARRLALSRELARAAAGYGGRIFWVRAGEDARLVPLLEEALTSLAEDDVELRVRLLARLAGALRDEHARDRRDALSAEAVALARRSGNAAALAYALAGRAHAITAPDTVDEILALGTELIEVATQTHDPERMQAGHMLRTMAQMLRCDVRGAKLDLAAAGRISDELGQPAQLWEVCAGRALVALVEGRLDEAEALIPQALSLGERALPEGAIPHHRLQHYALCDLRGNVEAAEEGLREVAARYRARPVFRCAVAHLEARLGRDAAAREALAELAADDVAALPFDQEWLYGMSFLAETASLLDDTASAQVLYRPLRPWAAFNACDQWEGFRGAVSRYLALLAAATGRRDDAERHFEEALALNASMGAQPLLAQTQSDFARMLCARDRPGDGERAAALAAGARAIYVELGLETPPGAV